MTIEEGTDECLCENTFQTLTSKHSITIKWLCLLLPQNPKYTNYKKSKQESDSRQKVPPETIRRETSHHKQEPH